MEPEHRWHSWATRWVARAFVLLTLGTAGASTAAPKQRLAVIELRPLDPESRQLAELLSEVVTTEVGNQLANVEVIGPGDIKAILAAEKQKELFGCTDDSCVAEVGGALGVGHLVVGTVGKLPGHGFRVDLRAIDARRARVISRDGHTIEADEDPTQSIQASVGRLLRSAKDLAPEVKDSAATDNSRALPLGLLVGGGVAVLGGTALGLSALTYESAKRNLTYDDAVAARSAAQLRLGTGVSVGLLGAGAVVAGYLLWPSKSVRPTAALLSGGVAFGLSMTFDGLEREGPAR